LNGFHITRVSMDTILWILIFLYCYKAAHPLVCAICEYDMTSEDVFLMWLWYVDVLCFHLMDWICEIPDEYMMLYIIIINICMKKHAIEICKLFVLARVGPRHELAAGPTFRSARWATVPGLAILGASNFFFFLI